MPGVSLTAPPGRCPLPGKYLLMQARQPLAGCIAQKSCCIFVQQLWITSFYAIFREVYVASAGKSRGKPPDALPAHDSAYSSRQALHPRGGAYISWAALHPRGGASSPWRRFHLSPGASPRSGAYISWAALPSQPGWRASSVGLMVLMTAIS